jgi:hypothetical protein
VYEQLPVYSIDFRDVVALKAIVLHIPLPPKEPQMKLPRRFAVLIVSLLFLTFPVTALLCGTERWEVKVCQDAHVKYLFKDFDVDTGELIPIRHTTVSKLHASAWPFGTAKHPPHWSWYQRSTSKVEYQLWEVNARFYKKKDEDEDYHLILKSGQRTLVAEIPSTNGVEDTPEPLKHD